MYTQLMLKCGFNALELSSKMWSSPYESNRKKQKFWISQNPYRLIFWYFSNFFLIPIQLLYCTLKLVKNFIHIKQSQQYDSFNVTFEFLLLFLFFMMLLTLVFNSIMCHQMKELCAIVNEGIRVDAYFMSKIFNKNYLFAIKNKILFIYSQKTSACLILMFFRKIQKSIRGKTRLCRIRPPIICSHCKCILHLILVFSFPTVFQIQCISSIHCRRIRLWIRKPTIASKIDCRTPQFQTIL